MTVETDTDTDTITESAAVREAKHRLLTSPAIDLQDAATLLGAAPSTVRRAITRGDFTFPHCRIGQRWILPSKPLIEFLHY